MQIWRWIVLSLSFVTGLFLVPTAVHAQTWKALESDPNARLGVWSCAATACHGGSQLDSRTRDPAGCEMEIWRERDPHARAAGVIEKREFAEILRRLRIIKEVGESRGLASRFQQLTGNDPDPAKWNPEQLAESKLRLQECMNCHNPAGAATSWLPEEVASAHADDLVSDGLAMNCETCHGNAKSWIGTHYRRGFNRGSSDFHDLKDLVTRGRVCAQCHVGDDRHDMNHDMIAAGHPPLRFELASYDRALPKHWNDNRARTVVRDYEIKLWFAGQIANFDNGLSLLESRLNRAEGRPAAPWPELAEFNCSSCHHRLFSPGEWEEREIAPRSLNAALSVNGWNAGLLQSAIAAGATQSEIAASVGQSRSLLEKNPGLNSAAREEMAKSTRAFRQETFRTRISVQFPEVFTPRGRNQMPLLVRLDSLESTSMNYDNNLQAYAFITAVAKCRLDEQRKTGIPAPAAAVALQQLTIVKPFLLTRIPGQAESPEERSGAEVGKMISAVAAEVTK